MPHVDEDPLASLLSEFAQCSELPAIAVSGGVFAGPTIRLPGRLLARPSVLRSKHDVADGSRQRRSGERRWSLPPWVSLGKSLFLSEPRCSQL